jgi:hypothetical protein
MYPVVPAMDWRKLLLSTPAAARRISLVSEGRTQFSYTERTVFITRGHQRQLRIPEAEGFALFLEAGSGSGVKSWIRIRNRTEVTKMDPDAH